MDTYPPLVFIVGAGASKDFGDVMPVGFELATRIRVTLQTEFGGEKPPLNGPIHEALRGSEFTRNRVIAAANRIRHAIHSKNSIDDLLHEWRDHPEMIEVGKIVIAHEILSAEQQTALGRPNGRDHFLTAIGTLEKSWLGQIIRNLPPENNHRNLLDILRRNIGFVIFNYDRCVERMLIGALVCNTTAEFRQAHAYVNEMAIIHPYGYLGREGSDPAPLGSDSRSLKEISKGIRTYTEEDHDPAEIAKLAAILSNAKRVVFLGFGYHPRSMDLLTKHGLTAKQDLWGTCKEPLESRLDLVRQTLFPDNAQKFMEQFRRAACDSFVGENINPILRNFP